MLTKADRNRIAVNLWTARIIPLVLAGVVGYATFVTVALLCVNYLLVKHHDKGAAIPILVIYFILFILMAVSFLRLVHVTVFDPPYVPLGAAALRDQKGYNEKLTERAGSEENGVGTGEYNRGNDSGGTSSEGPGSNDDPDSPGLELFYTKYVFVCEMDGRPIWCSQCSNWKPDRTHHDSSSGRCIRKMDHFCPWVGGPIGESNFKFFIQFNAYTALYCLHLLVIMAIYIHQENTTEGEDVNRHFCAILALATFFGLFTAGMTGTSLELAANNLTQVERLGGNTKVHMLAILKPSPEDLRRKTPVFAPEIFYREITYPLNTGIQSSFQPANDIPIASANAMMEIRQNAENSQDIQPVDKPADPSVAYPSPLPVPGAAVPPIKYLNNTSEVLQDAVPLGRRIPQEPGILKHFNSSSMTGPSAEGSTALPRAEQDTISPAGTQQSSIPTHEIGTVRETLSPRDLRATRTFAILKVLNPGDNPWDLGSIRLNLETVMGRGIVDWLLPIRRSPCCDHEDSESQFRVGPKVDFLRAACYFIEPDEVRLPKKTRKASKRNTDEQRMKQPVHDPSLIGPNVVPMDHLSPDSQRLQG